MRLRIQRVVRNVLPASRVADDVPQRDDAERHTEKPRYDVTHRTPPSMRLFILCAAAGFGFLPVLFG